MGLGCIALLLCVLLYQGLVGRSSESATELAITNNERAADGIGELPITVDHAATGPITSPRLGPLPPLPPEEVPLAAQLPVLLERATRGDPIASCRLAVEVLRCTTHQHVDNFSNQLRQADSVTVRDLGDPPRGGLAVGLEAHCAAFKRENVGNLDDLLERNKGRLSIRQKVLLALLQPDGSIMSIPREIPRGVTASATTRFVYSQFQADNALVFLQEGVRLHERLAIEGLILIHAPSDIPGFRPGTRVSLPNPRLFVGYSLLLVEVFGADALGPILSQSVANVIHSMDAKVVDRVREQVRASAIEWKGASRQFNQAGSSRDSGDSGVDCES